ncbi:MAG: hypothetical protein Q9198_010817, partial [Flavoplaca austrocitrina]
RKPCLRHNPLQNAPPQAEDALITTSVLQDSNKHVSIPLKYTVDGPKEKLEVISPKVIAPGVTKHPTATNVFAEFFQKCRPMAILSDYYPNGKAHETEIRNECRAIKDHPLEAATLKNHLLRIRSLIAKLQKEQDAEDHLTESMAASARAANPHGEMPATDTYRRVFRKISENIIKAFNLQSHQNSKKKIHSWKQSPTQSLANRPQTNGVVFNGQRLMHIWLHQLKRRRSAVGRR